MGYNDCLSLQYSVTIGEINNGICHAEVEPFLFGLNLFIKILANKLICACGLQYPPPLNPTMVSYLSSLTMSHQYFDPLI